MKEIFSNFQGTMNEASLNRHNNQLSAPYVADYYNIHKFYNTSGGKNAVSNILNSLLETLNKRERLARFIVIVLDSEIIETLNFFDYGATKELAALINWLTRQIDIAIRRKKLQVTEKRPEAININDPTIVYTTMIRHPHTYPQGSKLEAICSLRPKFNEILNEAVARQDNRILSIKGCESSECFERSGKLSLKGKTVFWQEMDNLLERYDRNKVKLTEVNLLELIC